MSRTTCSAVQRRKQSGSVVASSEAQPGVALSQEKASIWRYEGTRTRGDSTSAPVCALERACGGFRKSPRLLPATNIIAVPSSRAWRALDAWVDVSSTDSTPAQRRATLSQSVRVAAKPGSRSTALSQWPIPDVGASSSPGFVDGVAKGLAGLERGRRRGGDRDRLAGTRGLCPLRAGRAPVVKVPKAAMETGSSFARRSPMAAKTAPAMRSAVALVSESSTARRAPSPASFMSSSPVMARRDIPRSTHTAPASWWRLCENGATGEREAALRAGVARHGAVRGV